MIDGPLHRTSVSLGISFEFWRVISSLAHALGVSLFLVNSQAQEQPIAQLLYSLPEHNNLVFDVTRQRVYLTDPSHRVLKALRLVDGTEMFSSPLALYPTTLAICPDGSRLYVGEAQTNKYGPDFSPGKIAEIDLTLGVLAREVDFGFSPRGMIAVDGGILAISSPNVDAQGPELRLFDVNRNIYSPKVVCADYGITLDSDQRSLFGYGIGNRVSPLARAYFNTNQVSFTTTRMTTDWGFVAPPVASPDGTLLIAQNSAYRGSINPALDLKLIKTLYPEPGGNYDAAFKGALGDTFVLANGDGLLFFRRDTLECFRKVSVGLAVKVAYSGDWVYAVVLSPAGRNAIRLRDPGVGLSTNQPPVAEFTWEPSTPTTRQLVRLDALLSRDDIDTPQQLLYRWDFDNDGVFDTELSTNAIAQCRLRTTGSHIVTLETRDSYAATNWIQHSIQVVPEVYAGATAPANSPGKLAFPAAHVVFDPIRPYLYAVDRTGSRVVALNLTNGMAEHEWEMFSPPSILATSPDGSWLYVAQSGNPMGPAKGWLAVVDLETRVLTHEFSTPLNVWSMVATDTGWVVAHGETPEKELHAYHAQSGQRTGMQKLRGPSGLGLHPSQTLVYAAIKDTSPAEMQRFVLNTNSGTLGAALVAGIDCNGFVFPLPDGSGVLTGAGKLLDTNLNLIRNVGFSPVAFVPLPERGLFSLVARREMRHFDEDSWTNFLSQPALENLVYAAKLENRLYEVGVSATETLIRSRLIPAINIDQDIPPIVQLQSPTNQLLLLGNYVTLKAVAEDLDGNVQNLGFYANGQLISEVNQNVHQTTWQPPTFGKYQFMAVARDNLGATNSSAVATVTMNAPPILSLQDPAAAGPLMSPATFTVQVVASDPDGSITRVEYYYMVYETQKETLLGSTVTPPFELQVNGLVGMGGTLRAVAFDDRGAAVSRSIALKLLGLTGDDYYRPYDLSGAPLTTHANNSAAMIQQYEPTLLNSPAHTLWWKWTAPSNCVVFIDTAGSSFDTSLGVFAETNVTKLTRVIENDDDPTNSPASSVKFEAGSGINYRIVVGSTVEAEAGDVVLNLRTEGLPPDILGSPPQNDFRTNAILLAGTMVTASGNNVGASPEPAEQKVAGMQPRKSVWWTWRAPASGRVSVTTSGSDFDTVLGVLSGPGVIAGNDDAPGLYTSRLEFDAVSSGVYYCSVDGFAGASGNIQLSLQLSNLVRPIPPANDDIANSITLIGSPAVGTGYCEGATREPGEPLHAGLTAAHSVWWKWTATETGTVFLKAKGRYRQNSNIEVFLVIGVYAMAADSSLVPVGSGLPPSSYSVANPAIGRFQAVAGNTYYIAVDTKYPSDTAGDVELDLHAGLRPAVLSLELIELQSGGQVRLAIESSFSREVELQVSPDLANWQGAGTYHVNNRLEIVVPQGPSGNSQWFYRVAAPQ